MLTFWFLFHFLVPPTIKPANDEYTVTGVKDYAFAIRFMISDDFPKVQTENIFWKFTSRATGSTVDIQLDNLSEDRLSHSFESAQLSNRGEYTLIAYNEAGSRNATITMDVHGKQ